MDNKIEVITALACDGPAAGRLLVLPPGEENEVVLLRFGEVLVVDSAGFPCKYTRSWYSVHHFGEFKLAFISRVQKEKR